MRLLSGYLVGDDPPCSAVTNFSGRWKREDQAIRRSFSSMMAASTVNQESLSWVRSGMVFEEPETHQAPASSQFERMLQVSGAVWNVALRKVQRR
jgi:hypothetical protein